MFGVSLNSTRVRARAYEIQSMEHSLLTRGWHDEGDCIVVSRNFPVTRVDFLSEGDATFGIIYSPLSHFGEPTVHFPAGGIVSVPYFPRTGEYVFKFPGPGIFFFFEDMLQLVTYQLSVLRKLYGCNFPPRRKCSNVNSYPVSSTESRISSLISDQPFVSHWEEGGLSTQDIHKLLPVPNPKINASLLALDHVICSTRGGVNLYKDIRSVQGTYQVNGLILTLREVFDVWKVFGRITVSVPFEVGDLKKFFFCQGYPPSHQSYESGVCVLWKTRIKKNRAPLVERVEYRAPEDYVWV